MVRKFLTIGSTIADAGLIISAIALWSPATPILVGAGLLFCVPTILLNTHHKNWLDKFILKHSYNKIGLEEYTEMLKTGQLAKWREDNKYQVLQNDSNKVIIQAYTPDTAKVSQNTKAFAPSNYVQKSSSQELTR